MVEETAFKNEFLTFEGSWPWPWHWPWIGSYCIPPCITHRPLPKLHWNRRNLLWTDGRMHVRTDGRTDIWDPLN